MTLKTFLEAFVHPDALVRLWPKDYWRDENHLTPLCWSENEYHDAACLQTQILSGNWPQSSYLDCEILYLSDIYCQDTPEAINIVIKEA